MLLQQDSIFRNNRSNAWCVGRKSGEVLQYGSLTALNNDAGDQRLQVGTKIVAMVSGREETIISTDAALYGVSFVGAPFTFSV